ncbi:hypothetical protein FY528_01595 [Hymenobacter lutimineralis]|uniref:Uncharacterized protein n=2 Tax=Hymenobacter lutimineralis TaxID=2606448 RepID=A0A5D6VI29_9BACT|nr:hypothetical protein FY528_01595 [Hymenobacter lutimineralis]
MRDKARIKPMIEKLEQLWLDHPDFRLGQLLMVVAMTGEHNPKLFYLEDDRMLGLLEERMEQLAKARNPTL